MTTPRWDDPAVAATLREVVQDLGRRTVLDPARLRAALSDSLGSRAHQFRAQVDVLAVAAEEGLPQGLIDGEDRGALRARLVSRDVQPQVAAWALDAWDSALGTSPSAPLPATALPPTALPPVPLPPAGPRAAPPARPNAPVSPPLTPTALPPRVPVAPGAQAGRRLSPLLLAVLAVVLAAALVTSVVVGVRRATTTTAVASPPASATPAPATPAPTPSATPSASSTATPTPVAPAPTTAPAALTVLAHEGGSEHYALETAQSLVDAARRGYAAETDVRWTSDGVPVLTHDKVTGAPMDCGKTYTIADTSWATLKAKCRSVASASDDRKRYGLPRFDDVVTQVAAVPGAQLFAEVKVDQSKSQAAQLATILAQHQMLDRTVVTSFLPAELAKMQTAVRGKGGKVRLMQFVRDRDLSASAAKKAGLWAVAVREDAVTSGYVSALHKAGLVVIVWTPDDTKGWAAARKARADHVLTNRPGAYRKWQTS